MIQLQRACFEFLVYAATYTSADPLSSGTDTQESLTNGCIYSYDDFFAS